MNPIIHLQDLYALAPLSILLLFSMVLLLLETFAEQKAGKIVFYVTALGLILAFFAALAGPKSTNPLLTQWIAFDPLARFFTLFFILIGFAAACLSSSFFKTFGGSQGEYYFLLLSAVFGLILIGSSADFLTLFIGIETLSIALYVWCAFVKKWTISREAAAKYFLMGAMATAFLLYGIALVYGAIGTTRFDAMLSNYHALSGSSGQIIFLSGIALITLALAFEAAIVPFQVWAPDVYDGATTPVTAFMAVGTKVGAFAALIRIFFDTLPHFNPFWNDGIALLVYPTLIYANFVAIRQNQLRRFFAYSGISHAGYALIPLAAQTSESQGALLFYLLVYACATFGSFAVLSFLDRKPEGVLLEDLRGLFTRSPLLAVILTVCLLTLAGIPPTAGFFAKFYVFKVAYEAGFYGLIGVGLIMAIFSAYYYLRIIGLIFIEREVENDQTRWSNRAALIGCVCLGAVVWLSIYPAPLLDYVQALATVNPSEP